MGSHLPGQCLQLRESRFVADAPVFAGKLCSDKSRLRVNHFKYGGFAADVTQPGEAQAFGGGGHTGVQRGELIASGLGFGVGFVELRDKVALSRSEGYFGRVVLDFALLDFMLGGQPIPDRNINGYGGGVAQVTGPNSTCGHGAIGCEFVGVDAIGVVQPEGGKISAACCEHVGFADLKRGQRTFQLRVILCGKLVNFVAGGEGAGISGT